MVEYYNKKLYSILGLLDQYNKPISEYKYLLKYKFGINVESIHLSPQHSTENKKRVSEKSIDIHELYNTQEPSLQIIALMFLAINKCDDILRSENQFFPSEPDSSNEILASKCLYLITQTFLQAFFNGNLSNDSGEVKPPAYIYMTKSTDPSEWTNDSYDPGRFTKNYKKLKNSIFCDFFDFGEKGKAQWRLIPIFAQFERSVFFNPKTLLTRKSQLLLKGNHKQGQAMPKHQEKDQMHCTDSSLNDISNRKSAYENDPLSVLISDKQIEEEGWDNANSKYKTDVILTSYTENRYLSPHINKYLDQCQKNYFTYMKWFFQKYTEVDWKSYKKKYGNMHYSLINDFISERFLHFRFFDKLIAIGLEGTFNLEKINHSEILMPLVMTQNPYIVDTYIRILAKNHDNQIFRFGSSKYVGLEINLQIKNISQFTDYMNCVYYPALYMTFHELMSQYNIDLSKITLLLDMLHSDEVDKINYGSLDVSVREYTKNLIARMRSVKNAMSYCKLKDSDNFHLFAKHSKTIGELIFMSQRIFDYPHVLQEYFYCDNAFNIEPPSMEGWMKCIRNGYRPTFSEELLKHELNLLASAYKEKDLDSLFERHLNGM